MPTLPVNADLLDLEASLDLGINQPGSQPVSQLFNWSGWRILYEYLNANLLTSRDQSASKPALMGFQWVH